MKADPAAVTLVPGASAYVLVAKYRCDRGILRNAAAIRLWMPALRGAVLAGRASPGGRGVSTLSYCVGGASDPGQTVAVSPVERTPGATGSLR